MAAVPTSGIWWGRAVMLLTAAAMGCSLLIPAETRNDWGPGDGGPGDGDGDADGDADADDGVPCLGGARCDDGNPCTTDRCDPGGPGSDPETGCVHENAPNGSSCDGVFYCRYGETCVDGLCNRDTGRSLCDDGYECTDDPCDEENDRCLEPTPIHDRCPGGGWCEPADPRSDANGCTDGRECSSSAECDDGNWCNGTETCSGGTCAPGDAPCQDEASCAEVSCIASRRECARELVHARCLDGNHCTRDRCDPPRSAAGADGCVHEEISCDPDGSPCTEDRCNPDTGYCGVPTPGASCEGYFACVTGETCSSGGYCEWDSGAPVTCGPDGDPCTLDECDETHGGCYPPLAPGTACDSGDHCDESAACDHHGDCIGTPLDCRTSDPCRDGRCDPSTGTCADEPICVADGRCCPSCTADPDCSPTDGDADIDADVDSDVDADGDSGQH